MQKNTKIMVNTIVNFLKERDDYQSIIFGKGAEIIKEMIKEILHADMLLVGSTEPRHVPGKLFEALRTGNPIIAFGDNNEEVKKIIRKLAKKNKFIYSSIKNAMNGA